MRSKIKQIAFFCLSLLIVENAFSESHYAAMHQEESKATKTVAAKTYHSNQRQKAREKRAGFFHSQQKQQAEQEKKMVAKSSQPHPH